MPGAVVLVGRSDEILHRKAYGLRSIEPTRQPMQLDTIFDCASLTKVVATTPSVMMLVEGGQDSSNRPGNKTPAGFLGGTITDHSA